MPRNPQIEFDHLQMYFGDPYVIDLENTNGALTVYTPTIGDIIAIGEKRFYQTLNIFTCNTTQYRLVLWELGIDWNECTDFVLFMMLYKQIDHDVSKLLFGDLDFSKFVPLSKHILDENGEDLTEPVLWNEEEQIEINADVHNHFSQYLREMFMIKMEEKLTDDRILKQWYIEKDKRAVENAKKKQDKGIKSGLQPIISALVNHPGFKYKLRELKDVNVSEFYDSVRRLQVYEQSTALMRGLYSGMIDGSKISSDQYNFMREIK